MIITNRAKEVIDSVEAWSQLAPPAKEEVHWRKGRSAYELANAWMTSQGPQMPMELEGLLSSHPDTKGFVPAWGIPEYETKLDHFRGKGRFHDMIVMGEASGKKTLLGIEAKVDEPYGDRISQYKSISIEKNSRSKVPERIKNLTEAIFGSQNKELEALRYQLLHAVAGTLIEAKEQDADKAIFIVHEFVPGEATKRAKENEEDLRQFVEMLTGKSLVNGQLLGPVSVPGGGRVPNNIPLYIGKIESLIS